MEVLSKKKSSCWEKYSENPEYASFANEVAAWVRPGRTLDVGAGDGLITSLIPGAVGIDDDRATVVAATRNGANVMLASALKIPFNEGRFDNVLMVDVLPYLLHPTQAAAEVYRVLKEDGQLYVVFQKRKGTLPLFEKAGFRLLSESTSGPHYFAVLGKA